MKRTGRIAAFGGGTKALTLFLLLLALLCAAMLLSACFDGDTPDVPETPDTEQGGGEGTTPDDGEPPAPQQIAVTGVTLNPTVLSLAPNEGATLTATVLPQNATDKSVTWTSSNPAVVTVVNGVITAQGEGTATVTVRTANGKTATCQISVVASGIRFHTLAADGQSAAAVLPNATASFSFADEITVVGTATYTVCTDPEGEQEITSPTVALAEGNNAFYVFVQADGKELCYTVTIRRRPVYTVSFDTAGGSAIDPISVEEGETITVVAPTKQGYNFDGWSVDIDGLPITDNMMLTASWSPKRVLYRIEHYQQNLNNDGYTKVATENYFALTGTAISATAKDYANYIPTQEKLDGVVGADGLTVLCFYYNLVTYRVTFSGEGGTLVSGDEEQTVKHGAAAVAPVYQRSGYTFAGFDTAIDKVTSALSVKAVWKAETYTLRFWRGTTLLDSAEVAYGEVFTWPSVAGGTPITHWQSGSTYYKAGDAMTWSVREGLDLYALYLSDGTGFTYTLSDGKVTITGYSGSATDLVVPEYILSGDNRYPVTAIGTDAFKGKALTSVYFFDTLTEIGYQSFMNCTSLRQVTIPASVITFGASTFYGCSGLTDVIFAQGSQLTEISAYLFKKCTSLKNINIPATVTTIGQQAFNTCTALEILVIPDSVTSIGVRVLEGCSALKALTLPFAGASLEGTANTHFGYLFNAATYSDNASKIPASLTSVTVTRKCNVAATDFSGCTATVTYHHIWSNQLVAADDGHHKACSRGCGALGEAIAHYYTNNVCNDCGHAKKGVLYLLNEGGLSYTVSGYNGTPTALVIPATYQGLPVVEVAANAFKDKTTLASVVLGANVKTIGKRAFASCTALKSFTFEGQSALTAIGDEVFHKAGLTSFVIPATVTSLGQSVFHSCKSLKTVEFAQGFSMTALPDYLFRYCSALTSLVIPEGVTALGSVTLADCTSLKTLVLPTTLTTVNTDATKGTFVGSTAISHITAPLGMLDRIPAAALTSLSIVGKGSLGANAFTSTKLTTLSIASTITYVNPSAFASCPNIVNFTVPTWAFLLITEETLQSLTVNGGTMIAEYTFKGCTALRYLSVGETVTAIGKEAFSGCTALESVSLPASLGTMGNSVFYGCSALTRVSFASGARLASLPAYAFRYCEKLDGIVLPEAITAVGDCAFADCTLLSKIVLPNTVKTLGANAFVNCVNLGKVTISEGLTSIGKSAFYGCSLLGEIAIPATVTSIGDMAFKGCTALQSVYITDLAAWCNITFGSSDIYSAFAANPLLLADNLYLNGTRVTALTVPSGITQIKPYAFTGYVGLTTLTVPAGVTTIGAHAFSSCYSLTSVSLPASLLRIGDDAFAYDQKLTSFTLAEGNRLTTLGARAFDGCLSLTTLTLPATLKQVGSQAFYGTGLTRINITDLAAWCGIAFADAAANPMYTGGDLWLSGSKITKLTIPTGVTAVGDYAFYNGDFTTVTIPASLTSVGRSAFAGCNSLGGVYITDLAAWCGIAFANTQANPLAVAGNLYLNNALVTKLSVPASVTAIGANAFYGLKNLTGVYITDLAKWCAIDFGNAYSNPLYANGNLYLNNALVSTLTVPATVTAISDYAFYHCTSLTKVSISSATVDIGANAFAGCSGIQTLTVAENTALGHIGSDAFGDCTALKTVTLPANVAAVSHTAFTACGAISTLTAPASVLGCLPKDSLATLVINGGDTIAEGALTGAKKLTAVTVGQSITRIEKNAFADCTALAKVDVEDIGAWCAIDFGNAKSNPLYYAGKLCHNGAEVVTLSLPSSVTAVSDYAFIGCTSLKTLTLSDSVTSIGLRAFADCVALTKVTFTTNLKRIAPYAFAGCTALTTVSGGGTGWQVFAATDATGTSATVSATALKTTYSAYLWKC